MPYADLEMSLWRLDGDVYTIQARFRQAASAAEPRLISGSPPRVTFDLDALVSHALDPQAYGQALTQTLFADARVREAFSKARLQAESENVALRVCLRLDATDDTIHSLRWETLQDPERGGFLASNERVLISRYLDSPDMTPITPRSRDDLHALVVVANPSGLEQYPNLVPVDVAGEVERCRAALSDVRITLLARELTGKAASLTNISEALRDGPDILYLVAHGTSPRGVPILWLEHDDGSIARVDGGEFAARLAKLPHRPLLVVLVSCQSMGTSHDNGTLVAIGPQLASAGVAAVIAMQGNVTMATVAQCMPVLFRELRRDGQIDRALAAARCAVLERPDWWMPVLFLRLRDGMLWNEPQTTLPPLQRPQRAANFAGRETELAYFTEKLMSEHLAVITGMPGVGKTTLALVLAERVADATNIFWYSFSGPSGIAAIIEKLAIFLAGNGQDQLWRLLRSGGQLPTPEVLLDYLLPMLCGHGYVLCFDNFQYIDDDPLVKQCVARLRSEPYAGAVSLIITSRRLPKSIQTASFEPLHGLRLDDARGLLSRHGLALPDTLVTDLHSAISGNAKLLMLAIGLLQHVQDPVRIVSRLSQAQDIVRFLMDEVRADLTDAEDRVMGAVAVLLGEPGTRDAIEFILERSGVWDILYNLRNRYLLDVIERPAGQADIQYSDEYVQHSIVREFYYDTVLSKRQRQVMHRRAGEHYETEERDVLKAARQYERAGEYARAADLATADVQALINHGEAAPLRRLLEHLRPEQLDSATWSAVCTALGEVDALMGDYEVARSQFTQALRSGATQNGSPAQVEAQARRYRLLALVGERTGAYAQAEADCRTGLVLIKQLDQPNAEAARLYEQLATVLWRMSNFDAAEAACAAGLSALPSGKATRRERIQLWQLLATIDIERGRYDEAIDVLERSLTLAQELGDQALLGLVQYNLGTAHYYRGEADQARHSYQESLRIRAESGDVAGRIAAFNGLGLVHMANGETQAAMDCFAESSTLCERLGMPGHQAAALLNLGQLQLEQGRLDDAQANLKRACAIYTGLNDRLHIAQCRYLLGDLALEQGQPAAAFDEGTHALSLAQLLRSVSFESCALRVIGEALHAQGQLAEAESRLARAWQLQTEVNDPYDRALILAAWAALVLDQGSPELARSRAREALALAQEQHMALLSARLEALLERIGGDNERLTAA